jgi:hypothetical protein
MREMARLIPAWAMDLAWTCSLSSLAMRRDSEAVRPMLRAAMTNPAMIQRLMITIDPRPDLILV